MNSIYTYKVYVNEGQEKAFEYALESFDKNYNITKETDHLKVKTKLTKEELKFTSVNKIINIFEIEISEDFEKNRRKWVAEEGSFGPDAGYSLSMKPQQEIQSNPCCEIEIPYGETIINGFYIRFPLHFMLKTNNPIESIKLSTIVKREDIK